MTATLSFIGLCVWTLLVFAYGYSCRAMRERYSIHDAQELNQRAEKVLATVEPR